MKVKLFEIVTDKDKIDLVKFCEALNRNSIRDWAYIIHDKDETRPHYHIAVRLKNSYDTKYIAEWFGIGENFVGSIKSRWSDMLKYLTHKNAPEKHQYEDSEVTSNFDWTVERDKEKGDNRLDEIISLIEEDKIKEHNYFDYMTMKEYVKYKRSMDIAFSYRIDKLKGVERKMECIFITGDSGVGKTTYAKMLAERRNFSVFVSSGSNDIVDDYRGQDCIILDDLRGSVLGLSDLLKMLDNNTASTVKSRYRNKVLECKLIIITTTENIDKFFNNVFSDNKETIVQLQRRCETHIRMESDYMYIKVWDKSKCSYGGEIEGKNPVKSMFEVSPLSKEEELGKIAWMLTEEDVEEAKRNFYEQRELEDNDLYIVEDNGEDIPFGK